MAVFVRAKDHSSENWGVGKVIGVESNTATVAWFESPVSEPKVVYIPTANLIPVTLDRETRVYWLDRAADAWRVGRVLDADDTRAEVRFSNSNDIVLPVSELEVRWDRPIDDPSAFLAARINESPQFAQARTRFARSLITQRGACSGMSGLISSIIDLELHQFEVVKRVLQDPIQRYLLADEVGLGKTIEAGVLIRQYVLDNLRDHRVLVIVPPALIVQWRRELRKRFLLGDLLDDSVHVIGMNASPQQTLHALQDAGMVVIDEAHHFSRDSRIYASLLEAIIEVPRLLLLSATPVLHNEHSYLQMLHLLDPHVFRLEDEEKFRKRIKHRQSVAESVAGLVPENLFQIEDIIDRLTNEFSDDILLQNHAESLRSIVSEFPEESDSNYVKAITRLRAHLTETYKLDRRVLRNRRRSLPYLTPQRAGVERVEYSSADVARLVQSVEAWRIAAADYVYPQEEQEYAHTLANWFRNLLEAMLSDANRVVTMAQERMEHLAATPNSLQWEMEYLLELESIAESNTFDTERIEALEHLVTTQLRDDVKVIVFCTQPSVANDIREALQNSLSVPVDRHAQHQNPEDDNVEQSWEKFQSDFSHRLLICDAEAEEGLNLQGGAKVVIHYDLPLAPNRIEQRLGRVDRYGSGVAIRSFALCCKNDRYALAWSNYLDQGLKLFDRSVASLQYLIENEMRDLTAALLVDGVDAIDTLTGGTAGENGSAETELRLIDEQDALDSLTLLDEKDQFEELADVDSDWREVAESVKHWIVEILQIENELAPDPNSSEFGFGAFRFCFSYKEHGRNTLIPLKRILIVLLELLDPQARGAHSRLLKTGWYTCRRGKAIGTSAPPEGIRLVRLGEALIERIQQITELDDRGRAAAMWRHFPSYELRSDAPADVYLRFDFVVETDSSNAVSVSGKSDHPMLKKALERRGDMALAPFYKTIWVDESLSKVTNPNLLDLLEDSYRRAPSDSIYQDWNISSEHWPVVSSLEIPSVNVWHQWIPQAREAAEQLLRDETALEKLCQESVEHAREVDEIRFAQLRARLLHEDPAMAEVTRSLLVQEQQLSEAIYMAIRKPRISLATILAVFVSPNPLFRIDDAHG